MASTPEAARRRTRLAPDEAAATRPRNPIKSAPLPQPAATADGQRSLIFDYVKGLHATHFLDFGQSSGAFQQLAQAGTHGLNTAEVAEKAGWYEQYARFFLETGLALHIFELASEAGVTPRARYRFAPHMAGLLAEESHPNYLGGLPQLQTRIASDYARYPDLFRGGKAYPYAVHSEEFLRAAATATQSLPDLFLSEALPRFPELRKRLEAGAHVLDVGCGAGWAVVRLAETFPACRVVGIDAEPNAIEMAKSLIAFRALVQRAEVRLVRGEDLDYEAEFDVVTMFLVLHTIPPATKIAAVAHAARSLKRKGLLLLFDEAYPETAEEFHDPQQQLSVIDQWIEGPWGHRFSTPTEHRTILAGASLRPKHEIRLGRYHVILAERA